MSDDIISTAKQIWRKFSRGKGYRDAFVASNLSTNVAAQIVGMREERGWRQVELAERSGMAQARISVLEDPNYDKFTISTLKRIASAFDVALVIRFVPFSELLNWVVNITPRDLAPIDFSRDRLDEHETRVITTTGMASPEPTEAGKVFPRLVGETRTFTLNAAATEVMAHYVQ